MAVPHPDVIRAERRRRDLKTWLEWATPEYDWRVPHLELIIRELQGCADGPRFIILQIPVRHGKTTLGTFHFPVWFLHRNPRKRVILAGYNQDRADEYGRETLKLATRTGLALDSGRQAASHWRTAEGGYVLSAGVDASVTGWGGDLLLVDDPIRNRADAESPAVRKKVAEWFKDDFFTRREPGASVVIIQSRYHVEDLIGYVQEHMPQYPWENIRIPALAEEDDLLGREPGEALWPERYPVEELLKVRSSGEYSFAGLYQQRPFPRGSSLYKTARLEYCEASEVPRGLRVARGVDLASTGTEAADKTATARLCGPDKQDRYYVLHAKAGQWDIEERNEELVAIANRDGVGTRWILPQDPGSGGKDAARYLKKEIKSKSPVTRVDTERISHNKIVMSDPFRTAVNEGRVVIVRGEWNEDFVSALEAFPNVDDESDAASLAFNKLFGLASTEATEKPNPTAMKEGVTMRDIQIALRRQRGG